MTTKEKDKVLPELDKELGREIFNGVRELPLHKYIKLLEILGFKGDPSGDIEIDLLLSKIYLYQIENNGLLPELPKPEEIFSSSTSSKTENRKHEKVK